MGFIISDQIWRGDMLLNSKCRVVCTCIGSGFQNSAVRTRTIYLCSLSSTSRLCFWYGYADVFNHKVTFWISVISVVVHYQSQFIIQYYYRSLALSKSAWQLFHVRIPRLTNLCKKKKFFLMISRHTWHTRIKVKV